MTLRPRKAKTDDANESEGIDVTKDGTKLTSDRPEEPVEDDSGSDRAELRNLETRATTAKVRSRTGMLR